MTGNFTNREKAAQEAARDAALRSCSTTLWTLVFMVVFFTLGWNYGVTEIIQGLGGPDANINLLEGGLTLIALRTLTLRGTNGSK